MTKIAHDPMTLKHMPEGTRLPKGMILGSVHPGGSAGVVLEL